MIIIIGIAGPRYSGKDTTATMLAECLPKFAITHFAAPLKSMLSVGLGLSDEQLHGDMKETEDLRYGVTPRYLMETLGTEWGRNMVSRDLWFQATKSHIAECPDVPGWIIPDVRFENEAAFCRDHGFVVHIEGRGEHDGGHESRQKLPMGRDDVILSNSRSLDDLRRETRALVRHQLPGWVDHNVPSVCGAYRQGDEIHCPTCNHRSGFKSWIEERQCPHGL